MATQQDPRRLGEPVTPGVSADERPPAWTDQEEAQFRNWYWIRSRLTDTSSDPDDPLHYYDYRRAFRAGVEPVVGEDGAYHWPSRFKRLGHPNLVVDGLDTRTQLPVDSGLQGRATTARLLANKDRLRDQS